MQLNAANGAIAGLRIALETENAARRWLDEEGLFTLDCDA